MGNITLFTEPSGAYYFFSEEILAKIASNQDEEYLYILPVNRAVRYFKKYLIQHSGRNALIDPPIYTFNTLSRYLYSKLPNIRQIIPPALRLIYISQLLEKYPHEFEYLKLKKSSPTGLVSKTAQMLAEMAQFGIRPGNFASPPVSAETKYQDLTKLMMRLFDVYGDNYIDESLLMSEVAAGLNADLLNSIFPQLKTIYINGYGIYTPPMIDIIKILAESYQILIQIEYDPQNSVLFSHSYKAFDVLKPLASKVTTRTNPKVDWHKFLFNRDIPVKNRKELENVLHVRSVSSRINEVKYIAAKIRELYLEKNIPLHRIGVTFPDLEKYAPLVRKIFSDFAVPFNLSTGFKLSQSPLIQAYLQILTLRISNFETEEMVKLLSSPFLRICCLI